MPLESSLWSIRWGQVESVEVDGGFALTRGAPASRPGEEGSAKGGRDARNLARNGCPEDP